MSPRGNMTSACNTTLGETKENTTGTSTLLESSHRQILGMLSRIMNDAQHVTFPDKKTTKDMGDILEKTKTVRNQCDRKIFIKILFRMMSPIFQADTKVSEYSANLLDYFVHVCTPLDKDDEAEVAEKANLRKMVFRCCTKYQCDSRILVRVNILNVCTQLLYSLDTIESLNEKLIEALESMYLQRLKDKSTHVRAYAAKGLKYFQLAEDPAVCEVTKALCFHCTSDPNPEVRRMALKSIRVNKFTIPCIIAKVTDATEPVRVAAFHKVAKCIPMTQLKIDDREKILEIGLKDSSRKVKKSAEAVVDAWLQASNGDVIQFLSKMDVIANRDPCYQALNYIYDNGSNEAFSKVNLSLFGPDKLVPMKKLTQEVAFYWKFVIARFRQYPLFAEVLLPQIHDLCLYLKKYYVRYERKFCTRHGGTVLEQLLGILYFGSTVCEEGGRLEILELIRATFDFTYVDVAQVNVLLDLLYSLVEPEKLDSTFFNLIESMILESQDDPALRSVSVLERIKATDEKLFATQAAKEKEMNDTTALKLEFGTLVHKKHKLIGEKAEAVLKNDFILAAKLQSEIEVVSKKAEALRPERPSALSTIEESSGLEIEKENEQENFVNDPDQELGISPQNPNKFLPAILNFAFTAYLQHLRRQDKPSAAAITFYQTYITSAIVCDTHDVRTTVMYCLGVMGLTSRNDSIQSMQVCLQALLFDQESIAEAAFRSMFDLILHYGFEHFDCASQIRTLTQNGERTVACNSLSEESGSSLKIHVLDQLNSNNQTMVRLAATGLMKLTLGKRISSTKLVIRLLTMWMNPVYSDSELYQDMTAWLPLYAKMGDEQALLIADALIPALRKLVYAGRESPLADASPEKLVAFVASSTSSSALETFVTNPVGVHERMALNILTEMANLGFCPELHVFGKNLKFLNLRGLTGQALETLVKKVTRLLRVTPNRIVRLSLSAFLKHLNSEQLSVLDTTSPPTHAKSPTPGFGEGDSDEESLHISDTSVEDDEMETTVKSNGNQS